MVWVACSIHRPTYCLVCQVARRHPQGSLGPHDLGHAPPSHQTFRCQYDERVYGGEFEEKVRKNSLCAVARGSSEDASVARNGLLLLVCMPPRSRVTSGPRLLSMAVSGSPTVKIYVDFYDLCCHQGRGDARGVGCHWCPLWCPWTVPPPGPCGSE